MGLLFLLALAVHIASFPTHVARPKTFLKIWSLRRQIDAVCTQQRCATSEDRYWDVEDFFEANGIEPQSGTLAYVFYCAIAVCVAGVPAIGLSGYTPAIAAFGAVSPAVYYVAAWLTLFLASRVLALFRLTYTASLASSVIEATVVWLVYATLSFVTASPALFLATMSLLIATGFVFVGALFGAMCVPAVRRAVLYNAPLVARPLEGPAQSAHTDRP